MSPVVDVPGEDLGALFVGELRLGQQVAHRLGNRRHVRLGKSDAKELPVGTCIYPLRDKRRVAPVPGILETRREHLYEREYRKRDDHHDEEKEADTPQDVSLSHYHLSTFFT
jgi:hypothetical protein